MAKIRTVLQFFLIWLLMFLLVCIFIIPNTQQYKNASEKFEIAIQKQLFDYPSSSAPFRTGVIIGYFIYANPIYLLLLFTLQTLLTVFVTLYLKRLLKKIPRYSLLPIPTESFKKIFCNIFVFTLGIFMRRASEQLKF